MTITSHEQARQVVVRIASLRHRTFATKDERVQAGNEIAELSEQLDTYRAHCRSRGIPYATWSERDVMRTARHARGEEETD